MRIEDLNIPDLLEFDAAGGIIRFAGQRALLLDAVAMGLQRKYLVENCGVTATRTLLTQFGFAHGWRMAEAVRIKFPSASDEDWRRAGPHLHSLEGLYRMAPGCEDAGSKDGAVLVESYEAEQHLLQFGRSEEPVCWMISGLISGYLTRTSGREIFVLEHRCVGRGDSACHLVARSREEWDQSKADELRHFDPTRLKDCLDVSLRSLTQALKTVEGKIHARRRVWKRVVTDEDAPLGMVAKSTAMRQVLDMARRVAQVDATVLITGESGVGKECVARLIHDESPRAAGPFVAVNCGAVSETLLESELFGHARGAFTGASNHRAGLFEAANHGTLLLDEIGEISPGMQVKLLRVLQEREVRRVGENKTRAVDVRVLAATNRNLPEMIESGEFREDLYYRVKVLDIHVPALRERREDVLPLARFLLAESASRMKRRISELSPEVAAHLLRYNWPGNVRELENTMERAVALARSSRIESEDLTKDLREPPRTFNAPAGDSILLSSVVRTHILATLEENKGNQVHTAKQLGIASATLYRKLKTYGWRRQSEPMQNSLCEIT